MTIREKILFRASGKIGYPAPSTNAEREVLKELLREGLVKSAGRPQNSMTEYFRAA